MDTNEKKVEAVLFAVGREITTERIASLCALELPQAEEIITKIQADYEQKDHSLRIIQKENGWKLTVRDEFVPLVSSIVTSTELERPLMETLAVIAWKYPIVQSEIVKLRGSGAYEHMKILEEQGYVMKEKMGRTFKVRLTPKFFEYFDLPSEEAKQAFLKRVPALVLQEAEAVAQEADEVERLIEQDKKEQQTEGEIRKAVEEVRKEG